MNASGPKLISEMPAVAALVPLADVSHTAVASGVWSDPTIWTGGVVPGAGARVLIDVGVVVSFDLANSPDLDWVRVEGTLSVSRDVSTVLNVDTIITNRDSWLDWGTVGDPVPGGITADIRILDAGDLDPSVDTALIGRGIVALGQTTMHGADIGETFEMCSLDPLVGHTSVTLKNAPAGWNVGDVVKVGGTRYYCEKWNGTKVAMWPHKSEKRTITGISGNVVSFTGGLVNDHIVRDFTEPNTTWDLKTHVMNMTRNVKIQSENGAATPRHRRGHVMFMHNSATDIRFTEFFELGRTEKKYTWKNANYAQAMDPFEFSPLLADSNVKGRYACHFHKMGVSSLDAADQAILIGCSMRGTPGWGYVQHDSNVLMYNNTADGATGVAYVSEAGNERGLWKDCIAMDCQSDHGATSKLEGAPGYDQGRSGSAFQFASRQIRAVGLVAQSCNMATTYFHRGRSAGSVHSSGNLLDGKIPLNAADTDLPDLFGYTGVGIGTARHPIFHHSGTIAIACARAVIIEKGNPQQNSLAMTLFQDIKSYQSIESTTQANYTSHYVFKDVLALGFDDGVAQQNTTLYGFVTHANSFDIGIVDSVCETADYVFNMDNRFTEQSFAQLGQPNRRHFQSGVVAADIIEANAKVGPYSYSYPIPDETTPLNVVTPSVILAGVNVHVEGFNYYDFTGGDFLYDLTRTDSVGTLSTASDAESLRYTRNMMVGYIQTLGYWEEANGDKWLMLPIYFGDRGTGETHKHIEPVKLSVGVLTGTYSGGTNNGPIDFSAPPDLDNLTVSSVFPPLNGRVSDKGNDVFWYYPDPGFDGVEDVTYWLTDRKGYIERHVISFDASTTKFGDYIVLDLAGGHAAPVFGSAMNIAIMVQ